MAPHEVWRDPWLPLQRALLDMSIAHDCSSQMPWISKIKMLSVKKFLTVTTKDSGNKDSMGSVDLIQNLFYLTQMLIS